MPSSLARAAAGEAADQRRASAGWCTHGPLPKRSRPRVRAEAGGVSGLPTSAAGHPSSRAGPSPRPWPPLRNGPGRRGGWSCWADLAAVLARGRVFAPVPRGVTPPRAARRRGRYQHDGGGRSLTGALTCAARTVPVHLVRVSRSRGPILGRLLMRPAEDSSLAALRALVL